MVGKSAREKDQRGVQIGGNVNVNNGDFVAGDKNTSVGPGGVYVGGNVDKSNIVLGDNNTVTIQETAREDLFAELIRRIEERPNTPPEDREDLKANVAEIRAEAARGEQADEGFLERRLRNIARIAPDIAQVALTTLLDPAAGFAMVVTKVAERATKGAGD